MGLRLRKLNDLVLDYNLSGVAGRGARRPACHAIRGAWLTKKREHQKWLVGERYKLFAQMLTIATRIPKERAAINSWTYDIRDVSQRLHVLFKSGTAPKGLDQSIETVFQLARELKDGHADASWSERQRDAVRKMRKEMAAHLDSG